MKKCVYIVGIGMEGKATLTAQGRAAIEEAPVLIGARRMLEPYQSWGKIQFVCYDSEKIRQYIQQSAEQMFAVLMSGDCGFYSGAKRLLTLLGDCEVSVIGGIASPVYFSSRLKLPWQEWRMVSLHGVNANAARLAASNFHTFFLLGGEMSTGRLCRHLTEYGLGDVKVYVGENLCTKRERIVTQTAEQLQNYPEEKLCVLLVENPHWERGLRRGIRDEEFLRGKVPMTKEEVRSIVLGKLAVNCGDICWDIGSGTGSVSVEMALSCPEGTVHGVEKKTEAIQLCEQNARRFHCDNIVIHEGDAREIIWELPAPDCVFVGGSGGQLSEIVGCVFEKNPLARLVVTAVSLETLSEAVQVLEQHGHQARVVQAAVTRTKKVGSHTMWEAQNPIMIIEAV